MRAVIRRNKQLVCDEIADLKPQAGQDAMSAWNAGSFFAAS